tara:strand:- start:10 stop:543 length:534 start_codon:yes stop_codon:yes gene_type:complete
MQINVFSVPIWVGNIDASRIKIQEQTLRESFMSKIETSIDGQNIINEDSLNYLYEVISKLLKKNVLPRYKLQLEHIWTNYYKDSDYQENHAHPGAHLSFIIYKKIEQSNVVFVNPNSVVLDSYYNGDDDKIAFFGGTTFKPQCRENQIILFPSYLEHFVKRTNDAVSIAGNLYMCFE